MHKDMLPRKYPQNVSVRNSHVIQNSVQTACTEPFRVLACVCQQDRHWEGQPPVPTPRAPVPRGFSPVPLTCPTLSQAQLVPRPPHLCPRRFSLGDLSTPRYPWHGYLPCQADYPPRCNALLQNAKYLYGRPTQKLRLSLLSPLTPCPSASHTLATFHLVLK